MKLLKIEKYIGPDPAVKYLLQIEVELKNKKDLTWTIGCESSSVLKVLTTAFGPGEPYASNKIDPWEDHSWAWSIFWVDEYKRRFQVYLTTEKQATFCALRFGAEK